MAPNKQWMQLVDQRLDDAYIIGVLKFVDYAFTRTGETHEIRCPCVKCCNTTPRTREMVKGHLIVYGIIQNYTFLYHHEERLGEPQSDSKFEDDDETGSGGINVEELKEANSSEAELLDELNALESENQSLRRQINDLEREYERLASKVFGKPSSPTSSSAQNID